MATEAQALKQVERMGARRMRDLKIVRGNTGRLLAAQLLSDKTREYFPTEEELLRSKMRFRIDDYPESAGDFYELALNLNEDKRANCNSDSGVFTFYKFELTLGNYYGANEARLPVRTLQKDTKIPEARNCPIGYRMERVYVYKGRIAVFLNVYRRGYEGPDMDYMVVTGKMPETF